MKDNCPLVSISCITYNHAPYIRQCLDGFMMQQTNFAFEVLIHDDASTDGTTEIIKEYEAKFPDIIKPIFQTENQYSKGIKISATFNFPRVKGKYIAMCEGDDFWTDPLKLQKQVDFLEANSDYVICSHYFNLYSQNQNKYICIAPCSITGNMVFDIEYYVSRADWVTQPNTIMFKKECLSINEYLKYNKSKDLTLFYYLLKKGKGMLLKDIMSVYRSHDNGIWQGASRITRIKADLDTVMCIYNNDRDTLSAKLVKNTLTVWGVLGISFLKKNVGLYIRCLSAVCEKLGVKNTLIVLYRNFNYLKL